MEDKRELSEQGLEKVSGGKKDKGEGGALPIDSNDPHCVDCTNKLMYWSSTYGMGYDTFKCTYCGHRFDHVWSGDIWRRH